MAVASPGAMLSVLLSAAPPAGLQLQLQLLYLCCCLLCRQVAVQPYSSTPTLANNCSTCLPRAATAMRATKARIMAPMPLTRAVPVRREQTAAPAGDPNTQNTPQLTPPCTPPGSCNTPTVHRQIGCKAYACSPGFWTPVHSHAQSYSCIAGGLKCHCLTRHHHTARPSSAAPHCCCGQAPHAAVQCVRHTWCTGLPQCTMYTRPGKAALSVATAPGCITVHL